MFKNWDWHHTLILAAFVVGVLWAGGAAISALPAGQSAGAILAALAPVALLGISHIVAFFKSPPADPVQALQEGEQALGGATGKSAAKGPQAGFGRVGLVSALGLVTFVAIVTSALGAGTVATTGCSWWQKNSNVVEQWGEKDVLCVFNAIMSGAASYGAVAVACAPLTIEQIAQISVNIFDFYALQQSDAGLVGVALPPALSLPKSIASSDFAKLEAFVKSAH